MEVRKEKERRRVAEGGTNLGTGAKGGTGGEVKVMSRFRRETKKKKGTPRRLFFSLHSHFFQPGLYLFYFCSLAPTSLLSFSITVPIPPSLRPSLCRRWRVCGCRRLLKHGRGRLIIDGVFSSMQAGQRAAPAHSHASGPADSLSGASEHAHTCTQARIQRQTETHV